MVVPLAFAKILGIIVGLTHFDQVLSEWAYAGFLFDLLMASTAHHFAGHGIIGLSFYEIILVIVSRLTLKFR